MTRSQIDTFFNHDRYLQNIEDKLTRGEELTTYEIFNIVMLAGCYEAATRMTMILLSLTLIFTYLMSMINPLHPYQNLVLSGLVASWIVGWMYMFIVNIFYTPVCAIATAVTWIFWPR